MVAFLAVPGIQCSGVGYNDAMSLVAGIRLEQYEVVASIGAGGMGEVYRARDTRLGREVAIKVLPDRMAKDPDALARFEREAKALAALSHPNILSIFDFGSDQGVTYAVTELLDGETLRIRINRGELSWSKILEIASAITEGLAAAHSRGIIHRDLKPENIFLTSSGGVKILDFGLARLESDQPVKGESKMATVAGTEPGTILGTVGYMSPEQVRGQDLDNRTDIFSLGVILYEMVNGKCPFARGTAADTIAAILNYDPPELSTTGKNTPAELDRVILHCLEKNRDSRFQSAKDLAFDLKEVASGIRTTKPLQAAIPVQTSYFKAVAAAILLLILLGGAWLLLRRDASVSNERIPVAVADFVNETNEKELDGLSGMLITSLEQSRRLSVMTRSRMLDVLKTLGKESVKIDEQLGREICKQSNTSALIIATIRKFDQLYSIDLKVLDPQKNEYLFTTKQQGTGKASVPGMIDKLSEETRRGLNEKTAEIQAANRKVTEVTTSNLQAYQHFFKGEEFINKLKFKEAEEEFKQAVEIDPNFALAHFRMVYAISWRDVKRSHDTFMKAYPQFEKLPEKDQVLVRSVKAYFDRDLETCNKLVDQYLALYPNEKEAHFMRGDFAYHFGDYQTALTHFKKVLALDPNFERALQHLVWTYGAMDRTDLAVSAAKDYAQRTKSDEAYPLLFEWLRLSGQFDEAQKLLTQGQQLYPEDHTILDAFADIYAGQQRREEAEKSCKELIKYDETEGADCLSDVYAMFGMYVNAIQYKRKDIDIQLSKNEKAPLGSNYADLAYLYFLKGDTSHANDAMSESLRYAEMEEEGVPHEIFDTLLDLGRFEEAQQVGDDYIWGHRPFYDFNMRGYRALHNNDFASAAKEFEYLVRHALTWDRIEAYYNLGRCYMAMKKYDDAIRTLEEFLARPIIRDSWLWGPSLYLLAQAHEAKGDRASASEQYKKFLQLWKDADPDLPAVIHARKFLR